MHLAGGARSRAGAGGTSLEDFRPLGKPRAGGHARASPVLLADAERSFASYPTVGIELSLTLTFLVVPIVVPIGEDWTRTRLPEQVCTKDLFRKEGREPICSMPLGESQIFIMRYPACSGLLDVGCPKV